MIITQFPGVITDTSLPVIERDAYIVPGVEMLYDFATAYCHAGGNASNGAQLKDLTTNNRHSTVVIGAGSLTAAGGGFDFTGRASGDHFTIPSGTLTASIAVQSWLWMIYVKLPTAGNMAAGAFASLPWASWDTIGSYIGATPATLCHIGFTSPALDATGVLHTFHNTTAETVYVNPVDCTNAELTNFYGTVCQLAVWRTGGQIAFRLKNAAGTLSKGPTTVAACSAGTISTTGYIGIPSHAWAPGVSQRTFRIYRTAIEHLTTSGRTPATVLDADWTRTIARAVFS